MSQDQEEMILDRINRISFGGIDDNGRQGFEVSKVNELLEIWPRRFNAVFDKGTCK